MIIPTDLSSREGEERFERVSADTSPTCRNCKHMKSLFVRHPLGRALSFAEKHGFKRAPETGQTRVPGKGVCFEPTLRNAYPTVFHVADLMVCSMWAPND